MAGPTAQAGSREGGSAAPGIEGAETGGSRGPKSWNPKPERSFETKPHPACGETETKLTSFWGNGGRRKERDLSQSTSQQQSQKPEFLTPSPVPLPPPTAGHRRGRSQSQDLEAGMDSSTDSFNTTPSAAPVGPPATGQICAGVRGLASRCQVLYGGA